MGFWEAPQARRRQEMILPYSPQREHGPADTSWFQMSSLQNIKTINLCCFNQSKERREGRRESERNRESKDKGGKKGNHEPESPSEVL